VHSANATPPDSIHNLLNDLCNEIRALKSEVSGLKCEVSNLKEEVEVLKDSNTRLMTKLTQEVIAVKLENRSLHIGADTSEELPELEILPFAAIDNIVQFDKEIQQNDEKLNKFVNIILIYAHML